MANDLTFALITGIVAWGRGRCQFKQLKIVFARESGRFCLLSRLITLNNFLVYVLNDINHFSSCACYAC